MNEMSQNAASASGAVFGAASGTVSSLPNLLSGLSKDSEFELLRNLAAAKTKIERGNFIKNGFADSQNCTTVSLPEGMNEALAAAIAQENVPAILVVSSQREAEETASALRSWHGGNANDIAVLNAWETLPHERLSPRADTVSERMSVFYRLAHPSETDPLFAPIRILVVPVRSLIQPIVSGIENVKPLIFAAGDEISLEEAAKSLNENAYSRVQLVMERGQYAVRGGILDVFPPTSEHPARIDFFGDEIEQIKYFNVSDQRTYGEDIKRIRASACREIMLDENVKRRAAALTDSIPDAREMLESISEGIPVEGMESLMPVLADKMNPVTDLFDKNAIVMLCDKEKLRRAAYEHSRTADEFLAASWHIAASGKTADVPLNFDKSSFLDFDELAESLKEAGIRIWNLSPLRSDALADGYVSLEAESVREYRGNQNIAAEDIKKLDSQGYEIFLTAGANGTVSKLSRNIADIAQVFPRAIVSCVSKGFIDSAARIALFAEKDLTGHSTVSSTVLKMRKRRKSIDLTELREGEYVVHDRHGIGRFIGLVSKKTGAGKTKGTREYLVIEYAPSKRNAPADRLYVPVDQPDIISKYTGSDSPKLNKLGGSDWAATKAKARKYTAQIAQNLVRLYSQRQKVKGFAFSPDTQWQRELEDAFAYQETPDQLSAIEEVKADMEKPKPMDRLICGDVGFGKTEIAIRAAFKAVQDSKQVAVQVPTTLLANQHYKTFSQRLEGFPVTVAQMSRFQTAKEIKQTKEGLENGSIDIVIGTHKLLSSSVKFKDLGLVIIDEEQRFGVEHKEMLKTLKPETDVLSLSATPIPRTLEMAVTGIREMSTLNTAPEDRLPVLTYAGPKEDAQITAAIRRELLRSGQVFFIHNHTETISDTAAYIKRLVPEAEIAVAHGKMPQRQLDTVINDFWNRDIDVLVCTTIVETGLDIANANTLIVDRAERFGLSQLHQLRGRVGRGRERAYAYFLYEPGKIMTQTAAERLKTIAQNSSPGSGFDIAMKDLEIRGTGNLLGDAQSGHIQAVGFDMYVRMVSEAVSACKEPKKPKKIFVSVDLPIEASIPEEYIESDVLRMEIYRKIASAETEEDFAGITEELNDRYGKPPREVERLFDVSRLRLRARRSGITELAAIGRVVRVVGFEPRESVLTRMSYEYDRLQWLPSLKTVRFASPFVSAHGPLSAGEYDSDKILDFANKLIDDLNWKPQV